jgi:hypothetical protein
MSGNFQSSTAHMNGLVKLVEMRGGLIAFNENPVLQRVLTWSVLKTLRFSKTNDVCHSIETDDSVDKV